MQALLLYTLRLIFMLLLLLSLSLPCLFFFALFSRRRCIISRGSFRSVNCYRLPATKHGKLSWRRASNDIGRGRALITRWNWTVVSKHARYTLQFTDIF